MKLQLMDLFLYIKYFVLNYVCNNGNKYNKLSLVTSLSIAW